MVKARGSLFLHKEIDKLPSDLPQPGMPDTPQTVASRSSNLDDSCKARTQSHLPYVGKIDSIEWKRKDRLD